MLEITCVEIDNITSGSKFWLDVAWVPVNAGGKWRVSIAPEALPWSHEELKPITWERLDEIAGISRTDLEERIENEARAPNSIAVLR